MIMTENTKVTPGQEVPENGGDTGPNNMPPVPQGTPEALNPTGTLPEESPQTPQPESSEPQVSTPTPDTGGGGSLGGGIPVPEAPETINVVELLKRMEDLEKTNKMLVGIADKSRLGYWNAQNPGEKGPQILKVRTLGGKIVVAWKSLADIVEKSLLTGKYMEDQKTEVRFEDNTTAEMPLVSFFRQSVLIDSKEIERRTIETAKGIQEFVKLEIPEMGDKQIELNIMFVN